MDMVVQNLSKNVAASKELLRVVVPRLADPGDAPVVQPLRTQSSRPRKGPEDVKRKLAPLVGRYLA